ncbi:peptide ABC transporter ATP-binding protein [Pseudoalteromonas tunicata]|jgi:cationic peptide transport system ATP-binding protein|uniref:Peptide transport protein (ABC superfamily, atp_bind) n=1 Tax=Pseudoalteromonas tunicata D2 TaxID=87626 RepID=A4CD99_9GAMM|nr:oligopeptide/dipeptide ABC transporter ATP-binding protein [Pseudoalteromonas tunicata]ATC94048.1 dipeptide transport system ATP-binding protein [Pseudoalteromonas tunicata]AXT29830.1 ATP-binding cassette domain-containing protein [Pseudoalteromonas tunicata]EAR27542.1 peptide transport protein (ABC superfamily, atp_bind) [Pseudoalteromonas tunicata D2]MDP4984061.1 ATP-binding cassette domain-containing protein [Pseudoalteromonas tunicata]MDP5213780.1 ATP-binding cassette domain-containing 
MQLLDIRNLTIELETGGTIIRAVDKVNLSLKEGEVHALVGESGSGKSLIAKAIVGVLNERWKITADRMHWRGIDLMRLSPEKRRKIISQDIAMIYQEPSRCLDPTTKIFEQIEESIPSSDLTGFFWQKNAQRKKLARALLHKVGIREHKTILDSYPHELSEGICQKVMIAMAIARKPSLLIADEPTTALESTTRAQVFRLLKSLNLLKNMSILMISHELEELVSWTHCIHVLYCGQMVEAGPTKQIFEAPHHPYTQALLKSLPEYNIGLQHKGEIYALKGTIPTLHHLPIGCRLGPRCPQAQKACVMTPTLTKYHAHSYACHFPLIKDVS